MKSISITNSFLEVIYQMIWCSVDHDLGLSNDLIYQMIWCNVDYDLGPKTISQAFYNRSILKYPW